MGYFEVPERRVEQSHGSLNSRFTNLSYHWINNSFCIMHWAWAIINVCLVDIGSYGQSDQLNVFQKSSLIIVVCFDSEEWA